MVRSTPSSNRKPKSAESDDMVRLSVSVPRNLYDELDKIAQRDSRSMAWVIRKAAEGLVKQDQPLFHQT